MCSCSLEKIKLREIIYHRVPGVGTKKMETPFYKSDVEKRRGKECKLLLGCLPLGMRKTIPLADCTHCEESPQCHTLVGFSWTGCWAMVSRLLFAKKGWMRWSLRFPSNMVLIENDDPSSWISGNHSWSFKPDLQLKAGTSSSSALYTGT